MPVGADRESEEALDLACRLAAERRATIVAITVIEVPLDKPLDAELPEEETAPTSCSTRRSGSATPTASG